MTLTLNDIHARPLTLARCPRCRADVYRTRNTGDNFDVDVEHKPAGDDATPPWFVINDGRIRAVSGYTRPAGVVYAAHHCPHPHICRWCSSHHTPAADGGGSTNNNNEKGTQA